MRKKVALDNTWRKTKEENFLCHFSLIEESRILLLLYFPPLTTLKILRRGEE